MTRAILLLGLLACSKDKDPASGGDSVPGGTDSGGGDDSAAPPVCDVVALDATWPEDGLDPASRGLSITVSYTGTASAEGVVFAVKDPNGIQSLGTVTLTEGQAVWTPDELLDEDTLYTWTVSVCDATGGGSFTTGAYGDEVDPTTLSETAFSVDLAEATWLEPEGASTIFAEVFTGVMLFGVQSADDVSIDLIVTVGEVLEDGTIQQDPCFKTADFEPASFANNPYATVGPSSLVVDVQGYSVPLQDVRVSGAFLDGGLGLGEGDLTAEIDLRDLEESVGTTADNLCTYLPYLGAECEACSADGEAYCLPMWLTDIQGELVEGLTVVPNDDPAECD